MKKFLDEYGLIIVAIIAVAILMGLIIIFNRNVKSDLSDITEKYTQFGENEETKSNNGGDEPGGGGGGTITNPIAYVQVNAKKLTYNGSAQELITVSNTGTGTLNYKLEGGSYGTSIPKGTNAGIYKVYYKIANSSDEYTLDVNIAKANATITAPKAKTLTYNEADQELISGGSSNAGSVQYSLNNANWGTAIPKGNNAGNYTVYYKVAETNNYKGVSAKSISVTIKKVTPVLTAPKAKTLSYTGSAQELVTAGATTGGTLQYKLGTTSSYTTAIPTATNKGSYTIYYKVVGNDNYNDIAESAVTSTISTTVATLSKAPTAKSLTYNGSR